MFLDIDKYRCLLKLDKNARFIKIDHKDAMVAEVYKVERIHQPSFIMKICRHSSSYNNEVYFLKYFAKEIRVPNIIAILPPNEGNYGVVLMEYLSGNLLIPSLITKNLAFEIDGELAKIHNYNDINFKSSNSRITFTAKPILYFEEKFLESIGECKGYLSDKLIKQCHDYFIKNNYLLKKYGNSCIVHRDFRPGNIIVENNQLCGVIDWSSARLGFCEEDFCPMEHGEWKDLNGYKDSFLAGYSSIRDVPDYIKIMPLLRLNRAISVIGFTLKRDTWNTISSEAYQINRNFVDNFF